MDFNKCNIRLYLENETAFDHNKYSLSECISCIVTESVDGVLDLEMEYPLKDKKGISGLLKRRNIIKCPISTTDKRGEQLFKIRTATPNTANTIVKVYAQAISRRDLDKFNMVVDLKTTVGITRKQAMQEILSHCAKSHKFYVGNLDTNANTNINIGMDEETGDIINYLTINGISPRSAFLGETENSIYKAWGGEIIWNNFEVNMVDERGIDNSFEIRSGKNLQELEQSIDDTDLDNFVTAIMPVSSDGVYLPNHEIIYSPNHVALEGGFLNLVCDDVSLVDNTQAGFDVVYAQLRSRVQKKFDEGIDKLKINNTVKFVQLANTEEYKDFKILEKCEIGNNVTVKYYDPFDTEKKTYIEAVGRVLKIQFNVLTNRIEEVEIGDRKKKNILTTINSTVNAATKLNDRANTNKTDIKKKAKEAKDYADTVTNGLKVVMEARDNEIELSITNETINRISAINVLDGKISLRVTRDEFNSEINIIEGEIASKVSQGEFGSMILQHYNEIVNAVKTATENKTVLDENGFHVSGGGFYFTGYDGEELIKALSSGGMRLGDSSWDKETAMRKLLIGGVPFDQYLTANLIIGFADRVDEILANHGLITG
jgi:phage minor structural protein